MRSAGRVDFTAYLKAIALLVRNPGLTLAPLLMAVAQILLFMVMPMDSGGGGILSMANSSITSLLAQLLNSFGLAVSLIMAENVWRHGGARFDDAWETAKRNAGGILLAAIGFNFVTWIAAYLGSAIPLGSVVLGIVACFFFIYTLPAAAIGGVPGGAALQVALERARGAVLPTVIVTAVYLFVYYVLTSLVAEAIVPLVPDYDPYAPFVVGRLLVAVIQAIAAGYVALVLAKAYDDASYGRYYR
ncbi:MAG: hypothetical protein ACLPYS_09675 [Vulcanimicrobiaceae bacterium]